MPVAHILPDYKFDEVPPSQTCNWQHSYDVTPSIHIKMWQHTLLNTSIQHMCTLTCAYGLQVIEDEAKAKGLWSPIYDAYFPGALTNRNM